MSKLRYPRGWWADMEHCCDAASNYKGRRKEFKKEFPSAFNNLFKNNKEFLDNVLPSMRDTKTSTPRRWTDEKRWAAALQCSSRSEYFDRFNGAWKYDNEHGFLDRYTHFKKKVRDGRDPNAEDYVIYTYTDAQNKVVYVGLTYEARKEQRHKEHVYGRKEKDDTITYDAVARYWRSIGKPLPEPKYVMDGLHIDDVGYYEGWYKDGYERIGWKVLNIAKTGGIGGAKVKWNTYEAVAEKSKEYETRSQFCHGCSQAAKKAYHTYTEDGVLWIDTFTWLKDSHEARSEASRKRQTGIKLSEEHKKKIGQSVKAYYEKKSSV